MNQQWTEKAFRPKSPARRKPGHCGEKGSLLNEEKAGKLTSIRDKK